MKGGTTLEELLLYLDENGLTLTVLSAILDQTVAGAISTGECESRECYKSSRCPPEAGLSSFDAST